MVLLMMLAHHNMELDENRWLEEFLALPGDDSQGWLATTISSTINSNSIGRRDFLQ
jgi:hypothetical protein